MNSTYKYESLKNYISTIWGFILLTVPWQCSSCGSPAVDLAVLSQKPGYVLNHFWDQDYLLAPGNGSWDFASWAGLENTLKDHSDFLLSFKCQ